MNTGLADQMWADAKRLVPKPITARKYRGTSNRFVVVLFVPVVASDFM